MGLYPGAVSVKEKHPTFESYQAAVEGFLGESISDLNCLRPFYNTNYDPKVAAQQIETVDSDAADGEEEAAVKGTSIAAPNSALK